jgi:hypothetical protein
MFRCKRRAKWRSVLKKVMGRLGGPIRLEAVVRIKPYRRNVIKKVKVLMTTAIHRIRPYCVYSMIKLSN